MHITGERLGLGSAPDSPVVNQNRIFSQRDARNYPISTPQLAVVGFSAQPEQGESFGVILSIEHCTFNDVTAKKAENSIGGQDDFFARRVQCRLVYTGVISVKVLGL